MNIADTMDIKRCRVDELTADEKRKCGYLTFKSDGDLWWWLRDYPSAETLLIKEGDKIIAWAMRTPEGETGYYVRKTHRRQGLGSKMYYILNNRKQKTAIVKPHDSKSAAFFYSLGRIKKEEAVDWYGAPTNIKRKPRRAVMGENHIQTSTTAKTF